MRSHQISPHSSNGSPCCDSFGPLTISEFFSALPPTHQHLFPASLNPTDPWHVCSFPHSAFLACEGTWISEKIVNSCPNAVGGKEMEELRADDA